MSVVQELVPKKLLAPASRLQLPATQTTPITPGFAASAQASSIPVHSLSRWNEIIAMMLSSPMSAEASLTLSSFGDQLAANDWIEAAHVWCV
jgi:COPII coat assembly protein SEC16